MPSFRDARVPTGRELLDLAEITPDDVVDAKQIVARDAPALARAFNATRNDHAGGVTTPIADE